MSLCAACRPSVAPKLSAILTGWNVLREGGQYVAGSRTHLAPREGMAHRRRMNTDRSNTRLGTRGQTPFVCSTLRAVPAKGSVHLFHYGTMPEVLQFFEPVHSGYFSCATVWNGTACRRSVPVHWTYPPFQAACGSEMMHGRTSDHDLAALSRVSVHRPFNRDAEGAAESDRPQRESTGRLRRRRGHARKASSQLRARRRSSLNGNLCSCGFRSSELLWARLTIPPNRPNKATLNQRNRLIQFNAQQQRICFGGKPWHTINAVVAARFLAIMLAWGRHSNSGDVWKGWSGRHWPSCNCSGSTHC